MSPYRSVEATCDIWRSSVVPDELKELYTVMVCRACRSGKNNELLERQGYKRTIADFTFHHDYCRSVEITQQLDLSIVVNFNRQGLGGTLLEVLGGGDFRVGHKDFDRRVHLEVEEAHYPILEKVLESHAVRAVILDLLEPGRQNLVQLINTITSARWVSEGPIDPEETPRFDLRVLVLAHLMRQLDRGPEPISYPSPGEKDDR